MPKKAALDVPGGQLEGLTEHEPYAYHNPFSGILFSLFYSNIYSLTSR